MQVSRRHAAEGEVLRAMIINSGNANACTGAKGLANAEKMCELTAAELGISSGEVVVASTGRIGVQMPMEIIGRGSSWRCRSCRRMVELRRRSRL